MKQETQPEKLLGKMNEIYQQLDNLFFHINESDLSNADMELKYAYCDIISDILKVVLPNAK